MHTVVAEVGLQSTVQLCVEATTCSDSFTGHASVYKCM